MDDKQLTHLLTEIANEEIPDVNLWHDIQMQIERPRRREKMLHRVSRVLAAIAILTMLTAGAYAVYQEVFGGDPGLDAVQDEITEFNETKPLERGEYGSDYAEQYNLQATLLYAYADANRITVAYSITGEAPSGDQAQVWGDPDLTDAEGREFPYLPLGGGGGGGGGGSDPNEIVPIGTSGVVNFDSSWLTETPESLDLRLTINVAVSNTNTLRNQMILAGEAHYEFTLPFNAGRVVDEPQTVTASDIGVTLEKVVIAPSLTRFELCYDLPPLAETNPAFILGWQPVASLTIGGETIVAETTFGMSPRMSSGAADEIPCWTMVVPQSLGDREGAWTLTIHRFIEPYSENRAEVIRIMQSEGFDIEGSPGGGYTMPTNLTDRVQAEALNNRLNELIYQMQNKIEGEWVFTFSLE